MAEHPTTSLLLEQDQPARFDYGTLYDPKEHERSAPSLARADAAIQRAKQALESLPR